MQEELDVPILGHTPYDGIMPWSNTKESPKSSDFIIGWEQNFRPS